MTMAEAKLQGYDIAILPRKTDLNNNMYVKMSRAAGFEVITFVEEVAHIEVWVIAVKRNITSGTAAKMKELKAKSIGA